MSQLPPIQNPPTQTVNDIVKEAVRSFPFDERNDLPSIRSVDDFLNLYGVNDQGQRFYLTPHLVAFVRLLQRDASINQ